MNTADELDTLQIGPDPDKLERFHRQQLSAMLDGELSQDQARFLRRRLEHDAELAGCFERWQVCGDVLRGRQVSLLPPDFADRIARGIATGDVTVAPVAITRRPRLLRWGGGAALAASVALVALLVGRPGAVPGDADDIAPLTANAVAAAPAAVAADAVADVSVPAPASADAAVAGAALAGAAALAVAEVPRRGGERASRGQSQRAALRASQARQDVATRRVASAPARAAATPAPNAAASLPDASSLLAGAAMSSGLPSSPAPARPWPKASTLSADSSFSVRYGDPFAAPSWGERQAVGSRVLPEFPVDPIDAPRPQLRIAP